MFSRRSSWPRTPNEHARRLDEARASGRELIDLTLTNPTEVGLEVPWARIASALAGASAAQYLPEPLGLRSAREAVAEHYAARGVSVRPEQVVITASTSEAYALLFRLLADPDDTLIVPRPGYPLLDFLADLEPLALRPYRLAYDGSWWIDFESAAQAAPQSRAMLVVSPHNPTGHVVDDVERERLGALARTCELALIVDEVFADYAPAHRSFADYEGALSFTLSGLSKVALLPQLKLGWMIVSGPEALRDEALARLELIADAFLSVATPVQVGLRELLRIGSDLRAELAARIASNRAVLRRLRGPAAVWDVMPGESGWSALVVVPRTRSQDDWCAALLEAGVVVQPGHLFDIDSPHALVLSLLARPDDFTRGVEALARTIR